MKRGVVLIIVGLTIAGASGYALFGPRQSESVLSPITQVVERPLDKYTIDNLTRRLGLASMITLDEAIATTSAYTAYLFHYTSDGKKVTGLAHIPVSASEQHKAPVIVQFRGYVDQAQYVPGMGTKRSAEVLAGNGYISLAPDFWDMGVG